METHDVRLRVAVQVKVAQYEHTPNILKNIPINVEPVIV